ncbi:hypothetical protein SSCG_04873 [Streptomyces clavuligerus]|nr:hypothetical protein SSCG_04873 [Streptomyces clavuligerus]
MAAADRAGRHDVLQDRRVTLRVRRRARRWVYPSAFLAAVVSSFALPGAGGLLLAGIGAGLWLKAVRIGRREEDTETLYWVSVDEMSSAGAVGKPVTAFRSTGIGAGDAAPGGARRRR